MPYLGGYCYMSIMAQFSDSIAGHDTAAAVAALAPAAAATPPAAAKLAPALSTERPDQGLCLRANRRNISSQIPQTVFSCRGSHGVGKGALQGARDPVICRRSYLTVNMQSK